jgi:hypothetical protein
MTEAAVFGVLTVGLMGAVIVAQFTGRHRYLPLLFAAAGVFIIMYAIVFARVILT